VDEGQALLCLEGGGTRCQAALLDSTGRVLGTSESTDVNTNFVSPEAARAAILSAVDQVLAITGVDRRHVSHFASALVATQAGRELLGSRLPNACFHVYSERDVVFARAGLYRPHGVALVAATGATAWGHRSDDGRESMCGGWGSLLGDEGSGYAAGHRLLRAATRLFEGRITTPSRVVEALCERFGLELATFRSGLCDVAYQPPLSRAEIAGLAPLATGLAAEGDEVALQIVQKVAADLAGLALHVAHGLFEPEEAFDVAAAGGLFNAGTLILDPLKQRLAEAFPGARLRLATEEPAVALGHLVLHDTTGDRETAGERS
jgi:glucosamine kinase